MELFHGRFDEFVDHLVEMGQRTFLVVLDIDQELAIPSNFQRSSVRYLYNSTKIEIIHIETLQKLMVYLSKLQVENNTNDVLAIWNLPMDNVIMSKLSKLKQVVLGFSSTTDLSKFKRWI